MKYYTNKYTDSLYRVVSPTRTEIYSTKLGGRWILYVFELNPENMKLLTDKELKQELFLHNL